MSLAQARVDRNRSRCRDLRGDPLYTAARQVQRPLNAVAPLPATSALRGALDAVREHHDRLERTWCVLRTAERRQWEAAAGIMLSQLESDVVALQLRLTELHRTQSQQMLNLAVDRATPALVPSLRSSIEDLRQLEQEFDSVEYRPRERLIVARTEPITLNDICLGPFAIELRVDHLGSRADVSSFRCVALEPNPPTGNGSVTHPHVKDDALCAGDATVPIASALRQGRLCDAFCLVRSVLRQYNPHSPYVPMSEWEGARCEDCDCVSARDELNHCEHCNRDVCDHCDSGGCDLCDGRCCTGCLERDHVSRRSCCPDCRNTCRSCERTVDADSYVDEAGLCPACHESCESPESDDSHEGHIESLAAEAAAAPMHSAVTDQDADISAPAQVPVAVDVPVAAPVDNNPIVVPIETSLFPHGDAHDNATP